MPRLVDVDRAVENATMGPSSYDELSWADYLGPSFYDGSSWAEYDDIDIALYEYRCTLHRISELRDSAALLWGGNCQILGYGIALDIEVAELELEKIAKRVDRFFEIEAKRRIDEH